MSAKPIALAVLLGACATLTIVGCLFPWATIQRADHQAEQKMFMFHVCLVSEVSDWKECYTYTDAQKKFANDQLCPTWSHRLDGARAGAIIACICLLIGFGACIEKIFKCINKCRTGIFVHVARVTMLCAFIANMSAFIVDLLLYTNKPDDCIGSAISDRPGAKVGGAPFMFLAAAVLTVITFVLDWRCADKNHSGGASGSPAEGSDAMADAYHAAYQEFIPSSADDTSNNRLPSAAVPPPSVVQVAADTSSHNNNAAAGATATTAPSPSLPSAPGSVPNYERFGHTQQEYSRNAVRSSFGPSDHSFRM